MAPYSNKHIYEWNIRRLTERESFSPEVSESVRKLFSGLSGIQTVSVVNDPDPIYIIWSETVTHKKSGAFRDDDSGYLPDEGYFDVRREPSSIVAKKERVVQITFCNGSVLFFTEEKHTFILSTKKLYKIF